MEETILKFTLVKGTFFSKLETDPEKFDTALFLDSLLRLGFRDGDLFKLDYIGNKDKNLESRRTE